MRDTVMRSLTAQLDGSLKKGAKLASKATALTATLLDPDHAGHARVQRTAETYASASRFGSFDYLASQEALGVVAERRLVVAGGHQDITAMTARLRDMAEVHAHGPYFDRVQAFEALADERRAEGEVRGYVRPGDDRRELLLQVADVTAGWGRTIIAPLGYRELKRVFRCVLYNGEPLTEERAGRLDEEIREHRKLVASYVGRVP